MGGLLALERSRPGCPSPLNGSAVRALPGAARPRDRGAAGRAARTCATPQAAAHLQRCRAGCAARAGGPAATAARAAPQDVRGLLLAAGSERAAALGGLPARARR